MASPSAPPPDPAHEARVAETTAELARAEKRLAMATERLREYALERLAMARKIAALERALEACRRG